MTGCRAEGYEDAVLVLEAYLLVRRQPQRILGQFDRSIGEQAVRAAMRIIQGGKA